MIYTLSQDSEVGKFIKNYYRKKLKTKEELTNFILTHKFTCLVRDIPFYELITDEKIIDIIFI